MKPNNSKLKCKTEKTYKEILRNDTKYRRDNQSKPNPVRLDIKFGMFIVGFMLGLIIGMVI